MRLLGPSWVLAASRGEEVAAAKAPKASENAEKSARRRCETDERDPGF